MAFKQWLARWLEPPPLWPTAACALLVTVGFVMDTGTVRHGPAGTIGRVLLAVSVVGLWALLIYALARRRR